MITVDGWLEYVQGMKCIKNLHRGNKKTKNKTIDFTGSTVAAMISGDLLND